MTDTPHTSSHTARRGRSIATMLVVAGTFGLAACSDSPVAPTAAPLAAPTVAAANLTFATGGVTITAYNEYNGVTTVTAVVDPRTNVTFGGDDHKVTIPAYAICNPLLSGYGPTTWDAPCSPAVLPMTFQVKSWTDAAGNSRVEFKPDVRFSPSKVVGLYLKSTLGAVSSSASINWCRTGTTTCVNEAGSDASLATQRDATSGYVYRRVKHFSGYMVSVGFSGENDSTSTDSTPTYP
jgi:hypothetical protein